MIFIPRDLEKSVKNSLFQGKVVIIYGARQVGKTTLVKNILREYPRDGGYFNCEIHSVARALSRPEPEAIKEFFGPLKLVVLDEAQKIPRIGTILKVMVDECPEIQIIATGSSSFELADSLAEALTGRSRTFRLRPLSLAEIKGDQGLWKVEEKLESLLRFGAYPEIFLLPSEEEKKIRLDEIASDYLYKDVLSFEGMKKPDLIRELLELLALQLGQEVSYTELAAQLGVNRLTVKKYIDILEKSFVLFRLRALARNRRKEVSKSVKIYFCDLGLRNSIIQNYNRLDLRADKGALWENFCLLERMKFNERNFRRPNMYFWRNYAQREVDYVEEIAGQIKGYEFKWSPEKKVKPPANFLDEYRASCEVITSANYAHFLGLVGK